jgi:hypothetical protein
MFRIGDAGLFELGAAGKYGCFFLGYWDSFSVNSLVCYPCVLFS